MFDDESKNMRRILSCSFEKSDLNFKFIFGDELQMPKVQKQNDRIIMNTVGVDCRRI